MKKYTYAVVANDTETGTPADVQGKPVTGETDAIIIIAEEEGGIRSIGLNQTAWEETVKRSTVIIGLMGCVENLTGGHDEEATCEALSTMIVGVTDIVVRHLGAKGAAVVFMDAAEECAKRAIEKEEREHEDTHETDDLPGGGLPWPADDAGDR